MNPNGILIIDKDAGMTSHDVVGRVRRLLSTRRVGHGGTLDPMATGVLPVFVGRATRAAELAAGADKEYEAELLCGVTTDTQDTTGQILSETPCAISAHQLQALLPRFTGPQLQVPPMYSALKQDGKKLYELARQGVTVERAARPVTIHGLELLAQTGENRFTLRVSCSKGTYVRTLIHDLGAALGCGAAMSGLRRTRTGRFTLADAVTLSGLEARLASGADPLLPVDRLFSQYPALYLDAAGEARCRNGAAIRLPQAGAEGLCRVYGPDGGFLMLGRVEGALLLTEKNFFEPSEAKK